VPIELIAFDLDGTLVDSAPDIARAVQGTMKELQLVPPTVEEVCGWVGDGLTKLLKRALTGDFQGEPPPGQLEQARAIFRRAYAATLCVDSRLYPGTEQTLQSLGESCQLVCITNKSAEFTEPLLKALGIDGHFDLVVSGDSLPAMKPDPLPLLDAAAECGVAPGLCCMVGDSRNDILAARAAGFRAVGVNYGYRQGADLVALGAEVSLDSLPQLPPWLAAAGLAAPKASG
jgi:phosphoglycolate phosphatase